MRWLVDRPWRAFSGLMIDVGGPSSLWVMTLVSKLFWVVRESRLTHHREQGSEQGMSMPASVPVPGSLTSLHEGEINPFLPGLLLAMVLLFGDRLFLCVLELTT